MSGTAVKTGVSARRSGTPRASTAARAPASWRYWACLALLVLAAAGLQTAAGWFGWFLRKEAVELKRPLQLFDVRKLGPRYERHPLTDRIEPPSEDMIQSLGTREFLQVLLTDTTKPVGDATRVAQLFVTYYTGQPDMVPHTPDECYLAGGYDKLAQDSATVRVPGIGAPDDEVPLRVLQFRARQRPGAIGGQPDVATVMYFFHVNGGFTTTRNGVRARLSNPFQRYAYYAKIEVTYNDGGRRRAAPEASLAALRPLLESVMPVLLDDHFDLELLTTAGAADGQEEESMKG